MTEAALARCRSLNIEKQPDGRTRLWVKDPRVPKESVREYFARTPQDVARIKRAFMGQYRIPEQNVTLIVIDDPHETAADGPT